LAAASLVTSFLGGQVLAKPTLSNGAVSRAEIEDPGWIAIAAFVLLALVALWILWPRDWRLEMSADVILDNAPTGNYNLDDVYGQLARYHDENRRLNRKKLSPLYWWFKGACVLLVVETIAWIIDLGDIGIPEDLPGL
jgi:hypothetical protein